MIKSTFYIAFLLLGTCDLLAQKTMSDVKWTLDSALSLQKELKVKTAGRLFESLVDQVDSLINVDPRSSELWRINGLVKANTGEPQEAYSSFKTAILLDSMNLDTQVDYIRFTIEAAKKYAGDYDEFNSKQWLQNAFNVCAAALEKYPFNSRLHELAGDIYATANDIKNCTYHYEMAFKADKKAQLALKLYRLYAVNHNYKNEVKFAGILNRKHADYAEFFAVQAQLSLKTLEEDPEENNRYLPGIKATLMKAINLGTHNPEAYMNYFDVIKMGFSIQDDYRVSKVEINKVLDQASTVFIEMELDKAEILLEGANLFKDLGLNNEACTRYKNARALNVLDMHDATREFCN